MIVNNVLNVVSKYCLNSKYLVIELFRSMATTTTKNREDFQY